MVLDDSIWSDNEMPKELNHAVYLSYEDLPSCIKQCLLYCSLLPKTSSFFKDDIIGMWISEGFVQGISDNLEELGSKYYKELIVRNLIEPNAKYLNQIVCSMHDVVRSFAQFVSRDEALAAHSGETNIGSKFSAHKFLRLSLENKSSESDGLDWSSLQTQTMLRTLILVGNINNLNMKSGDLLAHFPSLRTLYADSTGVGELAEFLHEFKHLRYLSLENSDISSLPDNLGKLKFLQFISLFGSEQFVKLPHSIVQLSQLRYLHMGDTSICGIPGGFCVLTNLKRVLGFPAVEDGDWRSLKELGPLYQLTEIGLQGLENVSMPSFAAKSKLGEKVFDELCPPPNLELLSINGYFGRRFPTWMMSSSVFLLKTLRFLMIEDLACCALLPNGLCQLPYLEFIQISRAPAIKRVGPEFLQSNHHQNQGPSHVAVAFPKVHEMNLIEMVEWEEWEWVEAVQAFPVLRELVILSCKLTSLLAGLSSQAKALNKLAIQFVDGLTYVASFASLVRLKVETLPDLERITNLARLQILIIENCPKLKVLEGVPALQTLSMDNEDMDTLPGYMGDINPRCLELYCSLALLSSIAAGPAGPEWDKFRHVEHVKAYAREGDMVKKWYVLYTANPTYNLETNVSRSFMSAGTLSCFEDAQRFEYVFKMTRKTFDYICSLVLGPSMEDMNSYTFVDGRVLCLEDRVAVALIRLYSTEPSQTLGSSFGVDESTMKLVTDRFIAAICKGAMHHIYWPHSSKMDKIKSRFGKIHNMHNCCGVICTTHIPFGPTCNHEKNVSILMRVIVDPETRFMEIWLEWEGSMNWSSDLQGWDLFKECEEGVRLNGNKLKVALDGSEVGEYLIGDAGYPLLPWLLTTYPEEDLSDSRAEFNSRHSAATTRLTKVLTRYQDTWKFLEGQTSCPGNAETLAEAIYACCMLHNIVIDMENDEAMRGIEEPDYCEEVRQLADEDAAKARDMLSQYFWTSMTSASGVDTEDPGVISSGSGNKGKDQEVQTRTAEERQC